MDYRQLSSHPDDRPHDFLVERIIRQLEAAEESIGLAICAARGGGKSSVLLGIRKYFTREHAPPVVLVDIAAPTFLGADGDSDLAARLCVEVARVVAQHKDAEAEPSSGNNGAPEPLAMAAAGLSLGVSEAAQAALAFSSDEDDFASHFARAQLSPGRWEKFILELEGRLNRLNSRLVVIIDDLDLYPERWPSIARALAALRDGSRRGERPVVVTVVGVDLRRVFAALDKELDGSGAPAAMDVVNRFWALLGRPIQIPPFTSSRIVAFFGEPSLEADDGRCVWAWFLNRRGTDDGTPKTTRELQFDLAAADCGVGASAAMASGRPYNEAVMSFVEAYKDVDHSLELRARAFLDLTEGTYESFLVKLLYKFLPANPRALVMLTNALVVTHESWVKRDRPIDGLLSRDIADDRRYRLLSQIVITTWPPGHPLVRLLSEQAWPTRFDLEAENPRLLERVKRAKTTGDVKHRYSESDWPVYWSRQARATAWELSVKRAEDTAIDDVLRELHSLARAARDKKRGKT